MDTNVDRGNIQKEIESLKAEITRISDNSNFNGMKMLNGDQSAGLQLQVGDSAAETISVKIQDTDSTALGISGVTVNALVTSNAVTAANNAITTIKAAINTVSSVRGDLGALQNRLEHTVNNLGVMSENMTQAESRIRDVDMAKEMMQFTKNNVLSQAAQSMLAQANMQPQQVLQLLR
jgi:flagellin